jgi:hypothetical protein
MHAFTPAAREGSVCICVYAHRGWDPQEERRNVVTRVSIVILWGHVMSEIHLNCFNLKEMEKEKVKKRW